MDKLKKARLELVISMAIFGTLGPFVRNIALNSGELALYRAVLAALLIGLYLMLSKNKIPFAAIRKQIPLLFLSGIAMGINWILLFQAYKYTTVSVATLSYYLAPVLVTVACCFLFREKLTAKQIICFLMSTLGMFLIIGVNGFGKTGTDITGVAFGLGAAIFYAIVVLLNKYTKNVEGIHRTFLQFLAAIIVLIPYVAISGGFHLNGLQTLGWINLLIVGLLHTGITYCMYFSSLKELRGQEASILSYIDPLVAILVSVLILGEPITLWQGLGGILILGFAVWNEKPAGHLSKDSVKRGVPRRRSR